MESLELSSPFVILGGDGTGGVAGSMYVFIYHFRRFSSSSSRPVISFESFSFFNLFRGMISREKE